MYHPSEWRHVVGVVDEFFYHLDNEDVLFFQKTVSRLVGKPEQLNYFIRLEKLFVLRPKHLNEQRQRKQRWIQLRLHIRCFFLWKRIDARK